jgi:hypothetical protein
MGHLDPIAAIGLGLACTILVVVFLSALLVEDDDGPGASGGE